MGMTNKHHSNDDRLSYAKRTTQLLLSASWPNSPGLSSLRG